MLQLQERFLEAITKDCLLAATQVRKLIFQLRFNPENKECSNKEIAATVKKQLKDTVTIHENNELKEIIRALVNKFEAQMTKDEVDVEYLKSNEPGQKGKWKLVYEWLWQQYFPRWSLETQWQELVAKADKTDDWLQVKELTPVTRDYGKLQLPKPTIPLKARINLIVNWRGENRYLLLLNQGTSGDKFCLCPSKLFAPSNQLSQQEMCLPQDDVKHPLFFTDQGKEHFLGIVMEEPLDLAWLRPNGEEVVPALDAGRLHELLEKLELQGNWQMFYKSFEVV